MLSRGINEQCVSRRAAAGGGGGGGGGATHPADDKCYRGGGFLDEHRGFFTPGKKFRQPAYLATSFSVRANTHIALPPHLDLSLSPISESLRFIALQAGLSLCVKGAFCRLHVVIPESR